MLTNLSFSQQRHLTSKIQFSEDFGRRFLITVDTEEEFDWDGPFERSGHTTITVPKLERFQKFVAKYGISPIYFVDYSIVENNEAVAFLKSAIIDDAAAIGVHLHPWINPPFEEVVNDTNSFAGNLSKEIEEAKILRLRDKIEEATGHLSVIYRAGRYGVGPNTIDILERNGFVIDSSVRSHFDYSGEGGPNFLHLGPEPTWLNDSQSLLEIPLTTVFSGMMRQQAGLLSRFTEKSAIVNAGLVKTKLLQRIPLTPEGVSIQEAREAIDIGLDDGLELLVFSFHSPSLSAGHTPYVKTSEDLDRFYDWWREIISYLNMRGVRPISAAQLIEETNLRT